MRLFDTSVVDALRASVLRPFHTLELTFSSLATTLHFTTCPVPIYHESKYFRPRNFIPGEVKYSTNTIVDSVSFSLDNRDDQLTYFFLEKSTVGSEVVLGKVYLDSAAKSLGTYVAVQFEGAIDNWDLNEETVNIEVVSPLSQWSQHTLYRHSANCRWKVFGGAECSYATAAENTCDRSYKKCLAYGNTAHFGGFRWLPSIMGKEIWWGRIRGVSQF